MMKSRTSHPPQLPRSLKAEGERRDKDHGVRGINSPREARLTPRRWPPTTAELDALIAEAIVDAYGDDEQRVGFLTMIEDRLALPFEVQILGTPAKVERIDEIDSQIVAVCRSGRFRQAIPILELPLADPRPTGAEWIEAYRRWVRGR
jgi:hypothetical protein